ncbi:hypothetical protein NUKP24_18600 [Klebsiella variicola]|nr:hypothetical protein NUKP24_18600 [Klebsiella variicola]
MSAPGAGRGAILGGGDITGSGTGVAAKDSDVIAGAGATGSGIAGSATGSGIAAITGGTGATGGDAGAATTGSTRWKRSAGTGCGSGAETDPPSAREAGFPASGFS